MPGIARGSLGLLVFLPHGMLRRWIYKMEVNLVPSNAFRVLSSEFPSACQSIGWNEWWYQTCGNVCRCAWKWRCVGGCPEVLACVFLCQARILAMKRFVCCYFFSLPPPKFSLLLIQHIGESKRAERKRQWHSCYVHTDTGNDVALLYKYTRV